MTDEEREARIADLERKRAARDGNPIFRANLPALEAEIARLKAERAPTS